MEKHVEDVFAALDKIKRAIYADTGVEVMFTDTTAYWMGLLDAETLERRGDLAKADASIRKIIGTAPSDMVVEILATGGLRVWKLGLMASGL